MSDRIDDMALFGDLPQLVHFEPEPARRFLNNAAEEYQKCLDSRDAEGIPSHLPRASGLLFGQVTGAEIIISDIEFVLNIRGDDEDVMDEFETIIAPQFGEVYRNPGRGFWCDEEGVFAAIRRQAANGLELMGSIHSHPDWHEIGPPHERTQELSELPTRMDEYLFRQSCWPVNVIWYVHTRDGVVAHRVAAWRPGPDQSDRLDLRIPAEIHEESEITGS
ncbi:hypothetical protein [Streptomyces sp. NPDC059009]|uniref:hypothetical protein n=1 Tax=Streptomyces sp. NPDC059009 TaxID=3346694 RepID=UPI0036AC6CB8